MRIGVELSAPLLQESITSQGVSPSAFRTLRSITASAWPPSRTDPSSWTTHYEGVTHTESTPLAGICRLNQDNSARSAWLDRGHVCPKYAHAKGSLLDSADAVQRRAARMPTPL